MDLDPDHGLDPAELRRLIREMGEAGVAEMAHSPGLAAAVDQHAAAVRDVITASGGSVREDTLLDYAAGFADAAIEGGWSPAQDTSGWQRERVVAVYWMVRQARRDARQERQDADPDRNGARREGAPDGQGGARLEADPDGEGGAEGAQDAEGGSGRGGQDGQDGDPRGVA
jgi:hypothetical protein